MKLVRHSKKNVVVKNNGKEQSEVHSVQGELSCRIILYNNNRIMRPLTGRWVIQSQLAAAHMSKCPRARC